MTRAEQRLAIRTGVLGVLLTLLVIALDYARTFESFDRWLYDQRARHCQFFLKKPTTQLAYVNIDDQALLSVDTWPWPRTKIAEIVDEIGRAGAKVLAFDVIFSEPQPVVYEVEHPTTGPAIVQREIDPNQALADSFKRFGKVLVPASFDITLEASSPVAEQVRKALESDLELSAQDVSARLPAGVAHEVQQTFAAALRQAAYERIDRAMAATPRPTFDQLRVSLLPRTATNIASSALLRVLRTEFDRWSAQDSLRRFARRIGNESAPILSARDVLAPITPLAQAAAYSAFVDYVPNDDGVVRYMPLWLSHDNGLYAQTGLALACAMLDIDPADRERVKITEHEVTLLPRDRDPIHVPVHTIVGNNLGRDAGVCVNIPWFGPPDWTRMYASADYDPNVSADSVWQTCLTRKSLRANNEAADEAVRFFLQRLGEDRLKAFVENPLPPDDFAARAKLITSLLNELSEAGWLEPYENKRPEDFKDEMDRMFASSSGVLREVRTRNAELLERLSRQESQLRERLSGKAVLFGWVATAAAGSDFVPTSLHARCPGVVTHGSIFNGIMTGELWKPVPQSVNVVTILFMGLLTTGMVSALSPWKAAIATVVALAAFLAFSSIVLFDYANLFSNFAGAGVVVAAGVIWSGCTLMRLLVEGLERARITGRFRSYVDPKLVDYVLAHPEKIRMHGELRELSVVFTDLAGFTRISEKLGERTVGILNNYFDLVVPIIRNNHGYVNKFLGDGIMFVCGAPEENPTHASDAVETVLQMQAALVPFNERLSAEGLPHLKMRAGIGTDFNVVGDAGPAERSDYTVLGDSVNLASRLESANKVTGTQNLISARTAELLDGRYLLRPIGRLQVVGKLSHVMTYEALCRAEECTDRQKRRVELTAKMVNSYLSADFAKCIESAGDLAAELGADPLAELYREWCAKQEESQEAFVGKIVLTEK